MSLFDKKYTLVSLNRPTQLEIINKVSNNKLKKKNKKNKNQEINSFDISENEFNSIMNQNEVENKNIINKSKVKNIKNKYKQYEEQSSIINIDIFDKNIIGQEFYENIILHNNFITGNLLLDSILKKQENIEDLTWLKNENYGFALKKLFEADINQQLIGLLIIQNYCSTYNYPKILYKNNSIYLLRVLFQMFFTNDIFDEDVYWKWQEYLEDDEELDSELKNKLLIQTTEFFIILKSSFIDDENVNESEIIKNTNNIINDDDNIDNNDDNDDNIQNKVVSDDNDIEFNLDDL